MNELRQRRAPGFSTGYLLAPHGWTYDVASHYVVHSCAASIGTSDSTATKGSAIGSSGVDALPVGSSSNTARFECLFGEGEGTTLYITELFVPRASVQVKGQEKVVGDLSWTAERVRRLLHRSSCRNENNNSGTSSPLGSDNLNGGQTSEDWVFEITSARANAEERADLTRLESGATTSTSIYEAVSPLFYIFLEVVIVHSQVKDRHEDCFGDAVHRIADDLRRQYHTPALELEGFRCFIHHPSDPTEFTDGSSPDVVSSTTLKHGNETTLTTTQVREPCAPSILADVGPGHGNALWSVSLYSAAGGAFIQFLLPPRKQTGSSSSLTLLSSATQWNVESAGVKGLSENSNGTPKDTTEKSAPSVEATHPTARATRHLLQDCLALHWEGLMASTAAPLTRDEPCGATEHWESTFAVATLPLDALSTPTSLYSFASIEVAWEAHVTRCMGKLKKVQVAPGAVHSDGIQSLSSWSLRKLFTTPVMTEEALCTALERAEMEDTAMDNPLLTAAERAMRYVAASTAPSPIPARCTTYLLHVVADCDERCETKSSQISLNEPNRNGAVQAAGVNEEVFLLQLHNARVHSRHAVVACMPLPPAAVARLNAPQEDSSAKQDGQDIGAAALAGQEAQGQNEDSAAGWAKALSQLYRISSNAPSLWLPRGAGRSIGSGVCGRSGRLVVHIPSGDARYTNVRLAPVPAKSFTSLGSIFAWVCPEWPISSNESCVLSSSSSNRPDALLSPVGAVWTLVGDGRSAAAYLDDALMEYMYDTGSKNLNNIRQPSQHTRQPGVLVIRRRQRQKVKYIEAAGKGSLFGSHEVCSAWVDVGATHRLLLQVRDVGVGEVLVTEASLVGPHAEQGTRGVASGAALSTTDATREAASRAEEDALEQWIAGIAASAIRKNLR